MGYLKEVKTKDGKTLYKCSASSGVSKKGNPFIQGYYGSKNKSLSIIATPVQGKKKNKSKNCENWSVTITNKKGPSEVNCLGFFFPSTKVLMIPDFNLMMSPKKNHTSYYSKKK